MIYIVHNEEERKRTPKQCLSCVNLKYASQYMDGTIGGLTCFKVTPLFYNKKLPDCPDYISIDEVLNNE